jgi:hypothetical protein
MKQIKNKFLFYSLLTFSFSLMLYAQQRVPAPPPIAQENFE